MAINSSNNFNMLEKEFICVHACVPVCVCVCVCMHVCVSAHACGSKKTT